MEKDELEMMRVTISRALAAVHAALGERDARGIARAEDETRAAAERLRRAGDGRGPVREIQEMMQRLGLALGALGRSYAPAR